MTDAELRRLAEAATPGPDGFIVDPEYHHTYCQYYREGSACTCVEGKRSGDIDVSAQTIFALLDERDRLRTTYSATLDLVHEDVSDILRALGLGDHARPISTHEVIQTEILPTGERLERALKMSSMLFHGCDRHRSEFVDCEVGTCEQARAALARAESK